MDFNSLIGLDIIEAKEILNQNNFYDVKIKINSKENIITNKQIVCAVKYSGSEITLICGNFYFLND